MDQFLKTYAPHFEEENKWGWPLFWKGNIENTKVYLKELDAKCIELSSSYGLSGWLIATGIQTMEIDPKETEETTLHKDPTRG